MYILPSSLLSLISIVARSVLWDLSLFIPYGPISPQPLLPWETLVNSCLNLERRLLGSSFMGPCRFLHYSFPRFEVTTFFQVFCEVILLLSFSLFFASSRAIVSSKLNVLWLITHWFTLTHDSFIVLHQIAPLNFILHVSLIFTPFSPRSYYGLGVTFRMPLVALIELS